MLNSLLNILPIKDKSNPRLVIFSFLLLFLSVTLFVSNIIFLFDDNTPLLVHISNFLVWAMILFFFFYCKTRRSLVISSNIILGVSTAVLFVSLIDTGGLYSVDKIWAIFMICAAFLFSGIRSGIVFTVLSIVGISIYYYGEATSLWSYKLNPQITDANYVLITVLSAIIVLAIVLFAFVKTLELLQKKNQKLVDNRFAELNLILETRNKEMDALRSKLARDFHDLAGNKLASIKMISGVLGLSKDKLSNEMITNVETLETNANELFDYTRDFIWAMDSRNSGLDEVLIHISDFAQGFLVPFDIDLKTNFDLDDLKTRIIKTEDVLGVILIFKEAFTNAVKYAQCSEIELSAGISNEGNFISLEDNGIGFSIEKIIRKSGLKNMQERATSLSGQLEIKSSKLVGCKVKLSF